MIVYKELSTLCNELGFSKRALYFASNTIENRYEEIEMPKRNGGVRVLHVPDEFIKAIQKSIVRNILSYEEISQYATAYRYGGSTKVNAYPHIGETIVLKMDIRKFFDYINYPMVKNRVFYDNKYSEANRILLTRLCIYRGSVPQGAPTSPFISNIILRDFDNRVGEWCKQRSINYTRYCDDMTFSGEFDDFEVKEYIRHQLRCEGFYVNDKKTIVLHDGQRKQVTGIVVNEKLSIPANYKREIRQEIYYCKKYGVSDHLNRTRIELLEKEYCNNLLGRINYLLSIEPENEKMKGYRDWIITNMVGCNNMEK